MSNGTLYLGENAVSPSVASALVKYKAGENVQISDGLVISATDTKYTAGDNITIDNSNKISAKTYTAGNDIEITEDGTINSTALALPDPTGKELSVLMTDGADAYWEKPATFNLLDRKESDYLLNDIRWLRADTFSWQSGDLYPTVYEHLVEDFEKAEGEKWYAFQTYGGTPEVPTPDGKTDYTSILWCKTSTPAVGDTVYYSNWEGRIPVDTIASMDSDFITLTDGIQLYTSRFEEQICANLDIIGGVHIWYWESPDGHKIINPYHIRKYDVTNEYGSKTQSEHLEKLFQSTGGADYFILDKNNKRFKLPRQNKRKITHAYKQGLNWYNLYSDGWVEQGGITTVTGAQYAQQMISLLVPMSNKNYYVSAIAMYPGAGDTSLTVKVDNSLNTTTQVAIRKNWSSTNGEICWQVYGYAAKGIVGSHIGNFEYYYVGEFNKTSIEQAASVTSETLNSKVDTDFDNVSSAGTALMAHSSMPSAANYTDFTLSTSGDQYTMPADGWLFFSKATSATNQWVTIDSVTVPGFSMTNQMATASANATTYLPVSKGDVVVVGYTAGGATNMFRLFHCNGAS